MTEDERPVTRRELAEALTLIHRYVQQSTLLAAYAATGNRELVDQQTLLLKELDDAMLDRGLLGARIDA